MNNIRNPFVIALFLFCFAGINYDSLLGTKADIAYTFTYLLRAFVLGLGFILFLVVQKQYKDNNKLNIYIIIAVIYSVVLFSGIVNSNLNVEILIKYTFILGLYYYLIYCSYNYDALLRGLQLFYATILMLNLIFYLLFPEIGVYTIGENGVALLKGILTNRNSVLLYTLPLIIINNIIQERNNTRKKYVKILNFIAIITTLLTGSTTSILVLGIYIFLKRAHRRTLVKPSVYIIIIIGILVSLLFSNIENSFLRYIIGDVLGSDLTLSGRTFIWQKVVLLIPNAFFLGHGLGSIEIAKALLFRTGTNGFPLNDPFNGVLNILFFNGVMGLSLFFFIMRKTLKKLVNLQKEDVLAKNFIIFFLSFFLVSLSESVFQFTSFNFWIFVILTYTYKQSLVQNLRN